jgi:hypothetical protein
MIPRAKLKKYKNMNPQSTISEEITTNDSISIDEDIFNLKTFF